MRPLERMKNQLIDLFINILTHDGSSNWSLILYNDLIKNRSGKIDALFLSVVDEFVIFVTQRSNSSNNYNSMNSKGM